MSTDVEKERRRIDMTIEEALTDEFGKGIAEFRSGDVARPFVGDALVHLHDQLLGAINYSRVESKMNGISEKMLHDRRVEVRLRDLLFELRGIYRLREKRREAQAAAH